MKKFIILSITIILGYQYSQCQYVLSWFESLYVPGAKFTSISSFQGVDVIATGYCETDSLNLNDRYSFAYYSTDAGRNWKKIFEKRIEKEKGYPEKIISSSFPTKNTIFLATDSNRIYLSKNEGLSWEVNSININDFDNLLLKMYTDSIGLIADIDSDRIIFTKDCFKSFDLIKVPNSKKIIDFQFFLPDTLLTLSYPSGGLDFERSLNSSKDLGLTWNYNKAPDNLKRLNFFDFNYGIAPTKTSLNPNTYSMVLYVTSNNGIEWENIRSLSTTEQQGIIFDFKSFNQGFVTYNFGSLILEFWNNLKNMDIHALADDFFYYGFGFEHIIYPDFYHAYISNNMLQRIFRFDRSVVSVNEPNNYLNEFSELVGSILTIPDDYSDNNYELYDLRGVLMKQGNAISDIKIDNLSPGLYFLRLMKGTKIKIVKILKY